MKKIYFVHIPKTAGNSIRKSMYHTPWLANNGLVKSQREHHFASRKATRVLNSHLSFTTDRFPCYLDDPLYKDSYFSFTAVRNPYDLLVSYYAHYVDNSEKKNWIDNGWANVNGYHDIKSFEHFIDLYTSIDPEDWHVPSLCRNLFGQIFCDEGKSRVDKVIFTENLVKGIELLYYYANDGSLQVKCDNLPWANTSPKRGQKNYKDYYNESMIKKVRKKCEWELDTFAYTYDSFCGRDIADISSLESKA